MGICCMTQGTPTGSLWQSRRVGWGGRWEGGFLGRGHGGTYGWCLLMYDRKPQNTVKQWSFNLKNKIDNVEKKKDTLHLHKVCVLPARLFLVEVRKGTVNNICCLKYHIIWIFPKWWNWQPLKSHGFLFIHPLPSQSPPWWHLLGSLVFLSSYLLHWLNLVSLCIYLSWDITQWHQSFKIGVPVYLSFLRYNPMRRWRWDHIERQRSSKSHITGSPQSRI